MRLRSSAGGGQRGDRMDPIELGRDAQGNRWKWERLLHVVDCYAPRKRHPFITVPVEGDTVVAAFRAVLTRVWSDIAPTDTP